MSEQSEAKRDGTKLQPNSGRGQYAKGDGRRKYFLVDYKESEKTFSLSTKVWRKLVSDTLSVDHDLMPVLKVILGGKVKTRLAVVEWALVEEYERLREDYEELKSRIDELEN